MALNRVLLLVTARDRAQAAQMAEPLRVGAERALKALNIDGAESHVLMPIAGSQGPSGEHGRVVPDSLSNGVKLGGFDAAVEVTVAAGQPLSALVGCLEEVRESAGHVVDLARSAAVAGTDVVILEGDAPIRLVYGMKRKPGTTHRDFCRYWETRYTSSPGSRQVSWATPSFTPIRMPRGGPPGPPEWAATISMAWPCSGTGLWMTSRRRPPSLGHLSPRRLAGAVQGPGRGRGATIQ